MLYFGYSEDIVELESKLFSVRRTMQECILHTPEDYKTERVYLLNLEKAVRLTDKINILKQQRLDEYG